MIHVKLKFKEEKKHSYRFNAEDRGAMVSAIYIRKEAFTTPSPPEKIILHIDIEE